MPFVKGKSGNPSGGGRDKPWQDALRRAVLRRDSDSDPRKLDKIADKVVEIALAGDMQATKEIGDRLDGKAVQQIAGDSDDGALVVKIVRLASESGNGD